MTLQDIRINIRSMKHRAESLSKEYGIIPTMRLEEIDSGDSYHTPLFRVLPKALESNGREAPVTLNGDIVEFLAGVRVEEIERIFRKNKLSYQAYHQVPLQSNRVDHDKTFSREEAIANAYNSAKKYARILSRGTGFELIDETSKANPEGRSTQ